MKNMKNSTDATINGSKVNKRSIAVTAQRSLHRALFGETTAKKCRTVFSNLPPQPSKYAEIEAEGEEQEEGEEEDRRRIRRSRRVSEGMTEKKSTSMAITDPDVLDCLICFIPVFQVLESVEVPCPNASYGCNASLSYSKLSRHEALCIYTPCSCPMRAYNFLGFSNDLYTHFTRTHNSAKPIEFYSPKPISLKKNQRFLYLRDKIEGTIFVVNHHFCSFGSAVNVICIAPGSSARRFPYQLVVKGGETSIKLESVAHNIPNWDPNKPLKAFLHFTSFYTPIVDLMPMYLNK
ncbi:PREDICTED: E3 ubiquitin-protein ligase SINA-like 7 [Ipomoea nil]|uniref:E3 ubiquitin-protein ligase SINA-like 7 n=1 Tax=Ipomoea nil TaxID=35883 RepID=UPI0009009484|nr:PREDICTED: E3 ubiquitin-protein ligase SINA-like 7 [Ipomoea nil]